MLIILYDQKMIFESIFHILKNNEISRRHKPQQYVQHVIDYESVSNVF